MCMKKSFLRLISSFGFFLALSVYGITPQGGVANFSGLLTVAPGGSTPTIGFVASGQTSFLVRAVGPSLKTLGVQNPVASPVLHFFDSTGKEIIFVHSEIALNWPAIFASVGAFPLSGGPDAYEVDSFAPGAYTIQVTDSSGKGGTVLLEMYQGPNVVPLGGP